MAPKVDETVLLESHGDSTVSVIFNHEMVRHLYRI